MKKIDKYLVSLSLVAKKRVVLGILCGDQKPAKRHYKKRKKN